MAVLTLTSLAGGLNDSDPPIALSPDQCVRATNVEFYRSKLGERRRGADAIDLTGSGIDACTRVVWLHRHLPTTDPADAQLWALGITDPATAVLVYKDTTWHTVSVTDAFTIDGVSEYQVQGATLHGKLFLAYNSAVDRLHVWDGTSLRRVGLTALSTAPTGADSGSGTFATTRYYRTRETVQASGTTTLRSEASDVLTKTPSGSGSGLTLTRPTLVNSNATHWELEASLNNADFYIIATTAIGTTTAIDTTSATAGYGAFTLSEDAGAYEPPHSARLLMTDEDRLMLLGSWEDSALDSSVSWTPVYNAPGVGNDERITLDPVSVLNLDGFEGGSVTDTGRLAAGELGIFKAAHTYKLIRTGNRSKAYDAFAISKEVGALDGSVIEGVDATGSSALYFLDPAVGPYRYTDTAGLQYCGADVFATWQTVNLDATHVVARSLYDRNRKQVHWRIATGSSNIPDLGLVLQTNSMRTSEGGDARRGYSTVTGASAAALAMCLYADNIDSGADRSQTLVPLIAVEGGGLIWQCDTGDDDNGTEYAARITTKPYAPTELQREFEIKSSTIVAKAVSGSTFVLSAIPDGGIATTQTAETVDCTPAGSETFVIRTQDDLNLAECTTVQLDFADVETPGARWELAQCAVTYTSGQGK
jgi:hypothetical protein